MLSEWVYEVEDLIKQKKEIVYYSLLCLYRADMDDESVSAAVCNAAEHSITNYKIFECFRDIREREGGLELLVESKRLPDELDWTWKPINRYTRTCLHR